MSGGTRRTFGHGDARTTDREVVLDVVASVSDPLDAPGAPLRLLHKAAYDNGVETDRFDEHLVELVADGEVYCPKPGHYRVVTA